MFPLTRQTRTLCLAIALMAVAAPASVRANPETRAALDAALEQHGLLREELTRLRNANAALARSLASANEDSRAARAELQRIRAELDALGLTAFDQSERETRRRLIETMADIDRLTDSNETLRQQVLRLTEVLVIITGAATGIEPAQRAQAEAELRAAEATLRRTASSLPFDLEALLETSQLPTEGRIVSIGRDLGLAVVNIGRKAGIRVGMPVEFAREDRRLGAGLIVDVRDQVAGVVPVDPNFDIATLAVGDLARPRFE